MRAVSRAWLVAAVLLACSGVALAQESKSTPLARQLAAALDAAKLDSVAAKDPAANDAYIGVLYLKGLQLLTIGARYSAPLLMDDRLIKGEYRDAYIELNAAGTAGTKVFLEDLGADGLRARRQDNSAPDVYDGGGKRVIFDGDWGKQKLSEQEYLKIFAEADEAYARMLMALIARLKPTS